MHSIFRQVDKLVGDSTFNLQGNSAVKQIRVLQRFDPYIGSNDEHPLGHLDGQRKRIILQLKLRRIQCLIGSEGLRYLGLMYIIQ